jgi:hypothetical protein
MKLRHLLGAALALALSCAPALAQGNNFKTLNGANVPGFVKMCATGAFNRDGSLQAVPCTQWEDQIIITDGQQAVGVAGPNKQADQTKGAAIIQISPNSGAPQQYPATALPVTASANGTTGAITATLAALPGRTNFLCTLSFTGTNATAANTATAVTVTGTIGGTLTYGFTTLAAGAAVPNTPPLIVNFAPCVPASAPNTAIVVNGPALGGGATFTSVTATGFQL